jgi:hypothetical protein
MEVEVKICEILVSLVVEVLIGLPFVGIDGKFEYNLSSRLTPFNFDFIFTFNCASFASNVHLH